MKRKIRHHIVNHIGGRILDVSLVCLIVVLSVLTLWKGPTIPFKSSEVAFSDAVKGGILVVPASCSSPPPIAPRNLDGLQVANGINNREVDRVGINFCVTNTGGPTYFVPVYTEVELDDFYNASTQGLPGITTLPNNVTPPPSCNGRCN
jgi:hypothetical protein